MNRTPETIELLLRVADQIETEPERYDQASWVSHDNPCGTARCVAGWACWLERNRVQWVRSDIGGESLPSGQSSPSVGWCFAAMDLLGLSANEASLLFDVRWRPTPELGVVDALRKFAHGADLRDVTHSALMDQGMWY